MYTTKTMAAMPIISMKIAVAGAISPELTSRAVEPIAEGIPATMPARMIIEIPLPIPRSVICSPSHMRNIVPVTSVMQAVIRKLKPGLMTSPAWLCSHDAAATDWNEASSTVPQRVYLMISRRPCSPSFLSC